MNNVDPYNNAPPPRPGSGGGGCSSGKCATRDFGTGIGAAANQQYAPQQQQQMPQYQPQQQIPQYAPQRQQQQPPRPPRQQQQQQPDMVYMLQSDLQTAIQYIQQLGGTWPPPGQ